MKFKIMIYVYFLVSLIALLYAANTFSQKTTNLRIQANFLVVKKLALVDMTEQELSDTVTIVTGVKANAIKIGQENTKISTGEAKKEIVESQEEDVISIIVDSAFSTTTNDQSQLFKDTIAAIKTLRKYAAKANDENNIQNYASWQECRNSNLHTNKNCIEIEIK